MELACNHVEVLWEGGGYRLVRPLYGRASVCELAGTLLRAFDVRGDFRAIDEDVLDYGALDGAERVGLVLIDSLGLYLLQHVRSLLKDARAVAVLTSTAPSTTSTALVSMFYGKTPIEHGVLGYHLYLERLGCVVNVLKFTPIVNPSRDSLRDYGVTHETLVPHKTVFQVLSEAGVEVVKLLPEGLLESSFTALTSKGARTVGYATLADMLVKLRRELSQSGPKLVVAYWWGLDAVQHSCGTRSEEALAELRLVARGLREFALERLDRGKCRLVVASDHGQVDVGMIVRLDAMEEVVERLILPPTGEPRLFSMFSWDAEGLSRTLEEALGDEVLVMSRGEALSMGLFGRGGRFSRRLGDIVVACKRDAAFVYRLRPEGEDKVERLRAMHGGLTDREMLVPMVVL